MADDLKDTIRENAEGPAKAAGDSGSVDLVTDILQRGSDWLQDQGVDARHRSKRPMPAAEIATASRKPQESALRSHRPGDGCEGVGKSEWLSSSEVRTGTSHGWDIILYFG